MRDFEKSVCGRHIIAGESAIDENAECGHVFAHIRHRPAAIGAVSTYQIRIYDYPVAFLQISDIIAGVNDRSDVLVSEDGIFVGGMARRNRKDLDICSADTGNIDFQEDIIVAGDGGNRSFTQLQNAIAFKDRGKHLLFHLYSPISP
jgi:hypothetical protein